MKVPSLVGLTKDQAIAALTAQDVLLNTNIETVQTTERPASTVLRRVLRPVPWCRRTAPDDSRGCYPDSDDCP